jgi:DnaK suppressor protein
VKKKPQQEDHLPQEAAAKKPAAKKKTVARKAPAKEGLEEESRPRRRSAAKKKPATKKAAAKKPAASEACCEKARGEKDRGKKARRKKPRLQKSRPRKRRRAVRRRRPCRKGHWRSTPSARAELRVSGPLKEFKPYQPAPTEDYMSDQMLEHFRQILTAWKQELMEEVDRTVHHMKDEAANFPDPNDRATQESEFGLELRTRDRERKLLKKIDQALGRIDDGTYRITAPRPARRSACGGSRHGPSRP